MLKWIVERIEGQAEAVDTPIGRVPTPGALDLAGLDLPAEKLAELLRVDASVWREEAGLSARDLDKLGERVPQAIQEEQARLEERLAAA